MRKTDAFKKEWKKITWDKKEIIIKKTVLVAVVSTLFGIFISLLDAGIASLISLVP